MTSGPEWDAQRRARDVLERVRAAFGDRVAECRFDRDGTPLVTMYEPTDDDLAAIRAQAEGNDVQVRVERVEPKDVETWHRLRLDLDALAAHEPSVVSVLPGRPPDYRRPPVVIRLHANGVRAAAQLHEHYGDFVSLRVGYLPFPLGTAGSDDETAVPGDAVRERADRSVLPATFATVGLDGALTVASGETELHHVILTNHTDDRLTVSTNGQLTAIVVDPGDGTVVGGYAGGQRMPMEVFTAPPGGSCRIPLLVGTASIRPELGHAIPAGRWALVVPVQFLDEAVRGPERYIEFVSTPLPFTVTLPDDPGPSLSVGS